MSGTLSKLVNLTASIVLEYFLYKISILHAQGGGIPMSRDNIIVPKSSDCSILTALTSRLSGFVF
jgi:hypothetical protein